MAADPIAALKQLKGFYEEGFLTKEEYESRRVVLVDQLTNTSGDKSKPVGPQHAKREEKSVYAGRHFDKTNEDAMNVAEYVVVNVPQAHNKHLHTGAAPDNPYSFKTEPVPIDPNRGKVMPSTTKKFDSTTILYTTDQPGDADRMQQVERLEEERRKLGWDMFYAAGANDIPRLKELLDKGADVDQRDHDTEGTPIHFAASKGKKHAVYYLLERGATIDARNCRGETALHEAVKLRFNEIALWLAKHGADIHLENVRGYSPYDLALPWLQKELADARRNFLAGQTKAVKEAKKAAAEPEPAPAPAQSYAPPADALGEDEVAPPQPSLDEQLSSLLVSTPPPSKKKPVSPLEVLAQSKAAKPKEGTYGERFGAQTMVNKKVVRSDEGTEIDLASTPALKPASPAKGPVSQESVKVYFGTGATKTLTMTSNYTAKDLVDAAADMLNLSQYASYFDCVERIKGSEKILAADAPLLALRKKWPLCLGPSGNETELHCRFMVVPKKGTPTPIVQAYAAACGR